MTASAPDLGFVHRFDPPAPGETRTLLLLHGTGGDEHDLVPLAEQVAPRFGRLSPRGKVKEGAANRFFRRLAEGVFDVEDLRARALELADFVTRAAEHYRLDRARITALGFSNGANVAGAMLFLAPGAFGDAILLRPMLPFEPTERRPLEGRRILIAAGAMDPFSPADQVARLGALLSERGATVETRTQPAGHGLVRGDLELIRSWLAISR